MHVMTNPPLQGSNCLRAENSETSKVKKMENKMGGGGIETNGSNERKGRSQGALKLFCPKTNFPF